MGSALARLAGDIDSTLEAIEDIWEAAEANPAFSDPIWTAALRVREALRAATAARAAVKSQATVDALGNAQAA